MLISHYSATMHAYDRLMADITMTIVEMQPRKLSAGQVHQGAKLITSNKKTRYVIVCQFFLDKFSQIEALLFRQRLKHIDRLLELVWETVLVQRLR